MAAALLLAALAQGAGGAARAEAPPSLPAAPPSAATTSARPALRFDEVGAQAGARLLHRTRKFSGPYADVLGMFTAGGAAVAAGDYDNDGRDDLFVTDSDDGRTSHLLHNEGPGPDGVPPSPT